MKIFFLKSRGFESIWVMYTCDFWSLERNGSSSTGAGLNGVGGSSVLIDDGEAFGEMDIDLKARAFDFPLGGILLPWLLSIVLPSKIVVAPIAFKHHWFVRVTVSKFQNFGSLQIMGDNFLSFIQC